jgi:hypothetical protein
LNLARFPASAAPFSWPPVYFMALIALLALVLARQRWVAIAGILCLLGCMLAMLLLGRPGVPHVFPAPLAAIAVLALLDHGQGTRLRLAAICIGTALLAWISLNAYDFFRVHALQARIGHTVRDRVCALASQEFAVVWGAPEGFPDRYLYDPASPPGGRCALHIYHVGVMGLLPDNLQQLHAYTGGQDLIPALLSGHPIRFFTTDHRLDELTLYMHDHYSAKLTYTKLPSLPYLQQYLVQVEDGH